LAASYAAPPPCLSFSSLPPIAAVLIVVGRKVMRLRAFSGPDGSQHTEHGQREYGGSVGAKDAGWCAIQAFLCSQPKVANGPGSEDVSTATLDFFLSQDTVDIPFRHFLTLRQPHG